MASETPAQDSSTERGLDTYKNLSVSEGILTTTAAGNFVDARTITTTFAAVPPRNTAPSPPVALPAWSNQSQPDGHNTMATTTLYRDAWDISLGSPLLFGHLPASVPLFDEGVADGNFAIPDYGPDTDVIQSQLENSHLYLPQIDWRSHQELLLPFNDQVTIPVCTSAEPPTEIPQEGGSISAGVAQDSDTSHYPPFNEVVRTTHPPGMGRAVLYQPHLPHDTSTPEERRYDRPGKKPPAPFQPDPLKLEESCWRAGGSTFAVNWVISAFKYGVTTDALHRDLERKEINEMNFPGGFKPYQAYDGFISKVGKRYECGLCKEDNRTQWKNKKDAPRHLRKFHFGLADVCKDCGKDVFSTAEIKTHRCVRRPKDGRQAESSGAR